MDATTEFRPSLSYLQPTSKPTGAAAGRNPNPFAFGRCRFGSGKTAEAAEGGSSGGKDGEGGGGSRPGARRAPAE